MKSTGMGGTLASGGSMHNTIAWHLAFGSALCAAGIFSPPANAADGEWEWMVAPYLWGVNINTDLQTDRPPDGGISTDTRFDDVLDDLDGVFQIHAEGQNDRWGMFADFTFLGLADGNDRPRFSGAAFGGPHHVCSNPA